MQQALLSRLLPAILVFLPWLLLHSVWGVLLCLVALGLELFFVRKTVFAKWMNWLNDAYPDLEDSSQLLVRADGVIAQLQLNRMLSRLAQKLDVQALRALVKQRLSYPKYLLLLSYVLAALLYFLPFSAVKPVSNISSLKTAVLNQAGRSLHLRVKPPAYTHNAAFESESKDLLVPEHSQITWCESSTDGKHLGALIRLSNGQEIPFATTEIQTEVCINWQASETVFWTWSGDAKQTRMTIKVQADEAPQVKITAPTEMLQVLNADMKNFPMAISVQDDYQVTAASLHLTLARGSGENIRFSDKEMQLPKSSDPKQRHWEKRWTLTELGMEPGDELYFFVRATDNAEPTPHITTSPTYTVRLPALEAQQQDVSVLPVLVKPESLRSQRQIIIDTEQLLSDAKATPKLSEALFRARSEKIANDQATLRRRYGRFLGEESSLFGDEHEEHEGNGTERSAGQEYKAADMTAAFSHSHDQEENATLFDEATKKILRRALVAMWDAEKQLRAITPKLALPPEHIALDAIKQLQQADRIYLHKAAFTPPAIKEEKRLTGDVLDVKDIRAKQAAFESSVPQEIQELVRDLGNANALPALWAKTARRWIAAQIKNDEQRLAAQASVQDVLDGCVRCRANLRAWLRQGVETQSLLLQAKIGQGAVRKSAFELKWRAAPQGVQP
jgi:hypothetical protein